MPGRTYWFRRKRAGWGLEPGSRAGRIATAIFVIVDVGGVAALLPTYAHTHPWILLAWAFGWLILFLGVIALTGEPLR